MVVMDEISLYIVPGKAAFLLAKCKIISHKTVTKSSHYKETMELHARTHTH